jgi:hypothetical protein
MSSSSPENFPDLPARDHLVQAVENLFLAVHELATNDGTLKQRLRAAFEQWINRVAMFAGALSAESRALFDGIRDRMTREQGKAADAVSATVRQMTDAEVERVIFDIIQLTGKATGELAVKQGPKFILPFKPSEN